MARRWFGGSDEDGGGSSVAPFMIALVVVVLVLIAIGLTNLFSAQPDADKEQIIRAAIGQNDALQRVDHQAYADYTCPALAGTADDLALRQKSSLDARGARYLDSINNIAVNGDRATATVSYFFDSDRDEKVDAPMVFERRDGRWQVCSSGPS